MKTSAFVLLIQVAFTAMNVSFVTGKQSMKMRSKKTGKFMKAMKMRKGKNNKKGSYSSSQTLMDKIDLGNIRPEGIAEGPGTIMFTSELLYGGVKTVDIATGQVKQLVQSVGYLERQALGMLYDDHVLWVAGGGIAFGVTPALHLFDPYTGAEIITCQLQDAGLMNDMAIHGNSIYVTDSFQPVLRFWNKRKVVEKGNCEYDSIGLPQDFAGEGFRANGIVAYKDGLIINNNAGGQIWYLDLTARKFTLLAEVPIGDGLLLDGDILYNVENTDNNLSVFQLECHYKTSEGVTVTANKIGDITSDTFRVPTTVALFKDSIYAVNARFDIGLPAEGEDDLSSFMEDFDVVSVPVFQKQ